MFSTAFLLFPCICDCMDWWNERATEVKLSVVVDVSRLRTKNKREIEQNCFKPAIYNKVQSNMINLRVPEWRMKAVLISPLYFWNKLLSKISLKQHSNADGHCRGDFCIFCKFFKIIIAHYAALMQGARLTPDVLALTLSVWCHLHSGQF